MDWDDLRIFHAVAQAGSLNRAAATVDLHRSTVLRRIERLESALGQRLVDRGTDGISLTAAGERLLPHTERMLDEAVGLAEIADRDPGRPAGRIRVGATYNLAYGLLPKVIAEFRDAFPDISVELAATPDGY